MNLPNKSQTGINWNFILQISLSFLVSIYLILIAGNTRGFINLTVQTISTILVFSVFFVMLIRFKQFTFPLKKQVYLWVFVYTVTTLFSIDPRRSLDQFVIMMVGLFIFYIANNLETHGWSIQYIIIGLLLTGTLFMLLNWGDFIGWYFQWNKVFPNQWVPTLQFRTLSANVIAFNLNLFLLIAVNYLFNNRTKKSTIFLLILFILSALILIYLTSSRGGWLGLLAALGVFVILTIYQKRKLAKQLWRWMKKHTWVYVGIGIIFIVFLVLVTLVFIAQSNHPTHGNIITSRQPFWKPALQEFLKHPLTGTGPFTFGTTFLGYNSVPLEPVYAHAHGTPINILSEMGLLGLGAAAVLWITILKTLIKQFQKNPNQLITKIALTCFTAFNIHSLVDCFHLEPGGLWMLIGLIGLSITPDKKNTSSHMPWFFYSLPILLLIGLWINIPFDKAVEAANQRDWGKAVRYFEKTVDRDPWFAIHHQQLGLTYAILAEKNSEQYLDKAIEQLEITTLSEPGWVLNYANLASLYLENNNFEKAYQTAEKAIQLAPNSARYQILFADISEKLNKNDLAYQAYQKSLDLEKTWVTADFWDTSPVRKQARDDWQKKNPPKEITIEIAKKDLAENNQSRWAYNQLAAVYLKNNKVEEAEILLKTANLSYTSKPIESIETQWLLAEVYAMQGNYEQAINTGENALYSYQWDGIFGPGSFGLLEYAPRVFRSPAMGIEIVPQIMDMPKPHIWVEREDKLIEWESIIR